MPTATFGNHQVEVNDEGFLTDPTQWNKEIADAIAKEVNIPELTPKHWELIDYLRKYYTEKNDMPSIRFLKKNGIIPIKDLYSLFPDGPLKKASKIAGLPKPYSCV
ncbi:MAG: TusE/DsrC/DsvC family sulfur relay protein [bacterium]|nr:TusE/DsrC/DsvC family sulfur relay protein [bacterium]